MNLFPSCYAFLKFPKTRKKLTGFLQIFLIKKLEYSNRYIKLKTKTYWSILKRSSTPKSFDSRCNLCLEEKIHILLFPEPKTLLNKKNELIARCRHRAKFKL